MSFRTAVVVAALVTLPLAAEAAPATNGKFVNTDALNGKFVNGREVNGKYLNTADVGNDANGWPRSWKDGLHFYDLHVSGTGLASWVWDWSTWQWTWQTGEFFEGTRLQ